MADTAPELQRDLLADFEFEIYGRGLAGEMPRLPISIDGLQERAREVLSTEAYGYVAGGGGAGRRGAGNGEAVGSRESVARRLRDVSVRELSTIVLGTPRAAPVMLAPVGVQSIIHSEAELAAARAAGTLGVPFILSTAASRSIEQVAEAMGTARRWYQLYWPNDRELAASFLARAERASYEGVVVTLDTWLLGW